MVKNSSVKKIQRVQRAGVSRSAGQRRPMGFPLLIAGIMVVGTVLVVLARSSYQEAALAAPQANKDHFHNAVGVYVCDEFVAAAKFADVGPDLLGIHSHGDGLMHIHPFKSEASGRNATWTKWASMVGLTVKDGEFDLPPAVGLAKTTWKDGDACGGDAPSGSTTVPTTTATGASTTAAPGATTTAVPASTAAGAPSTTKATGEPSKSGTGKTGVVKMFRWPPQAGDKTKPEVFTTGLADLPLNEDGALWVLAFVPEGVTPPLPPSQEKLRNPADVAETPAPGNGAAVTTPGSVVATTPGSVVATTPGSVVATTPGSVVATTPPPTAATPTSG